MARKLEKSEVLSLVLEDVSKLCEEMNLKHRLMGVMIYGDKAGVIDICFDLGTIIDLNDIKKFADFYGSDNPYLTCEREISLVLTLNNKKRYGQGN